MPIDPTPRSAYAHWNEEQNIMWWEEVGKHASSQMDEPMYPEDYPDYWEEEE